VRSKSGENLRTFYGRRRVRRLRPAQKRLLAEMLPRVAVDLECAARDPGRLFDPPVADVWLEIGFGAGEHLAAQAGTHPEIGLIGCEPYLNGVARLLGVLDAGKISNVRVFADDARLLLDRLPDASIGRCFILFPDPWPKGRHHRRRIVAPGNLAAIARILRDGAELRMASDHTEYVRWMLFHTLDHGAFEWLARGPADWRARPSDWPATRYEEKALARGAHCAYLRFRRRERPA